MLDFFKKGIEKDRQKAQLVIHIGLTLLFLTSILITDLVIGITKFDWWHLPTLILIQLVLLILVRFTNTSMLAHFNMAQFLIFVEIVIFTNPTYFHVMVFWTGILALLAATTLQKGQVIFWHMVILFYNLANGYFIWYTVGNYSITVSPVKFSIAGLFFAIATVILSTFYREIVSIESKAKINSYLNNY